MLDDAVESRKKFKVHLLGKSPQQFIRSHKNYLSVRAIINLSSTWLVLSDIAPSWN